MALIESASSYHWLTQARIVEEDRELAWAEPHVRRSEDVRWILGNYVQTSTSEGWKANQNGHIFPWEDIKASIQDIPHRPLNYLHIPNRRVGTFVAAEFVFPNTPFEDADLTRIAPTDAPIVEALACFWLYYDDGLWPKIEQAYQDGQLCFSMEAVPEQITCIQCNSLYDYDGPSSQKYCDHLQERRSKKILHRPHFLAGALIAPPVKPGWKGAHVKEISELLDADPDNAEIMYREIAGDMPGLNDQQIENIMAFLMFA